MEDLTSQLRIGFCSLIVQAKGDSMNSFVAWLDLKVAEYKVYGHMILTEDDNENSSSWQPTSNASVAENKPCRPSGSQGFRFNGNQTGIKKHRSNRWPHGKGLAKGLSAITKSVTNLESAEPCNYQYNRESGESQSFDMYDGDLSVKTEVLERQVSSASSNISYNLSDVVELDSVDEFGQNTVSVKLEPPFDQSVGQEPANCQSHYLPTQLPVTSQSSSPLPLSQNHSLSSQFQSPGPGRKPASHIMSPAKSLSGTRRTSSMSSSISGLLSTHTIETEAGYQCKLCNRVIKSPYNAVQHIKEVHLKIVNYHCPVCLTGFNRPCKLTEHLRKHHPNITYE